MTHDRAAKEGEGRNARIRGAIRPLVELATGGFRSIDLEEHYAAAVEGATKPPQELVGRLSDAILSERERCVRILEFHGYAGMANALREQDPDTTYNEFLDGSK